MIWLVPSTLALLIKGLLFFYSDVHKKKNFFIFLLSSFLLNSIELIGFFRFGYDLGILKLYYCVAVFTVSYLVLTCSNISKIGLFTKSGLPLAAACTLAAAILFTDSIVAGVNSLPNGSITRIAGEHYFIFQIYMVSALVLSISILIWNSLFKKDKYVKRTCFIALLAFTPFILLFLLLMLLMQLGYHINMAGFLSLTICIMLFVFITLSDKHKLFTMMKFVPFSRERLHHLEMKELINRLSQPSQGEYVDIKELLKEVELLVIKHTYHYVDSQKEVARRLKISEGNLSQKINKKT